MTKSRTPGGIATDRESQHDRRTELVRDMMAKESAALDARTAKLRALRLAKEAEDSAAKVALAKTAPAKAAKPARARQRS